MSRRSFWSKLFGSRIDANLRDRRQKRRLVVEGLEGRMCLSTLDFATYLGGPSDDHSVAIAVDSAGNSYVAGLTYAGFPTTSGAYDTSYNGAHDGFVAKFNSSGALVWATYLGGSGDDGPTAIAVDGSNNVYVTGATSGGFPTTPGAFQSSYGGGSGDNFIAKLSSDGSTLIYSTYVGGGGDEYGGFGIAVDASGNAFIGGSTRSGNYPTTMGAFQFSRPASPNVGTVTALNATGTGLVYATYLDGNFGSVNDGVYGIAVDAAGNAYVSGNTAASDFPTTAGVFQAAAPGGGQHAFVAKLNATGSGLIYSTFISGSSGDTWGIGGLAIDSSGNAYTAGWTDGSSFPTTAGALQTAMSGGTDVFVAKLNPTGTALVFSTYLGGSGGDVSPPYGSGIAVDPSGDVFLTGLTNSVDFPNVNGVQAGSGGLTDAFAVKLNPSGASLSYSTYLGGSGSENSPFMLAGIAANAAGDAYVTGNTSSTNFPTVNPAQPTNGGGADAFVAKISSANLAASTTDVTASDALYDGNPHGASASVIGDGGLNQSLTVTYVGISPTVYGPSTTTPTNAGAYSASAFYAGDANHTGSSDSETFEILKANSTTTVNCPSSVVYNGSAQTPCSASVTGAGGLSETLSVAYANNTNAGTASASAAYAGDANHSGSSDSKTFEISKASSTTTVNCPSSVVYNSSAQTPCSASVTGAGGLNQSLPVAYLNNTDVGTATASASYGGDANHTGSSAGASFAIVPKDLTATGSTENTINIAKAGTITFVLRGVTGIAAGDGTVSDLFNGATFQLRLGGSSGTLYSVTSTATVLANGDIQINWRMTQELYNDLYALLGSATPSNKTLADLYVFGTSNDGNYTVSEDVFARIFKEGKAVFSQ